MRAAVMPVPWAHPDRADRYETSLDAVLKAGPDDQPFSPWIILEDGRMLTPKQVIELRKIISRGAIAAVPGFWARMRGVTVVDVRCRPACAAEFRFGRRP